MDNTLSQSKDELFVMLNLWAWDQVGEVVCAIDLCNDFDDVLFHRSFHVLEKISLLPHYYDGLIHFLTK